MLCDRVAAVALLLHAGCASQEAPPLPPVPPIPAPPPLPYPPASAAVAVVAAPSAAPSSAAGESLLEADPAPIATVRIEPPYKLGERPEPKTQAEYKEQIRELRHWNQGGLGELIGTQLPALGHPDPRVVINVARVKGPHDPAKVQQLLRRNHWINVVRCYRLGAFKNSELRGWTKATVALSAKGKIHDTRLIDSELDDHDVASCMVGKLALIAVPAAAKKSQAWIELRVGPGDEPMPPPEDLLVAGDGTLELEAMQKGVEAGLPAFAACYRAAFAYAPGLWGRMLIRYHVTERGKLDEAFEASGQPFPDSRTRQCALHAARMLRFSKPEGGDIRFLVPLRFFSDRSKHELAP